MMLVGWGGNNGSTLTAGILANKEYVAFRDSSGYSVFGFFWCLEFLRILVVFVLLVWGERFCFSFARSLPFWLRRSIGE